MSDDEQREWIARRNERTRAVKALADAYKQYDDANPDVGFPPPYYTFVDQALKKLGYSKEDVDYSSIARR